MGTNMKIDSNTSIDNNVILKYIQNYSIFNGNFESFQTFVTNNDTELSSDISQFLILYDEDKKIIYAKNFELITKHKKEIDIGCNLIKGIVSIFTILKNQRRSKKGIDTKFEILKKENLSNIIEIDNNIKILLLEMPKEKRSAVNELQETLEWFLKNDFFKYQLEMKENLEFLSIPKLLFMAYLSLVVGTVIRVLDIFPFTLISESDIILTVKILLSILFATVSFLFIISVIVIYIDHKSRYSKYNLFFYGSKVIKWYLIIFSLVTIFSSLHYNINSHIEKFFPLLYKWSANIYINSKTLMVYDYDLNKTIIYLDSKEKIYYYYDSFKIDFSKLDTNNTSTIKEKILGTHETNSTTSLLNGHWKMKYIKELNFDYNDTIILKSLTDQASI